MVVDGTCSFLKCDTEYPYNLKYLGLAFLIVHLTHTHTHSNCGKMLIIIQKLNCEYPVHRCLLYCSFNYSVYLKAMAAET